MPPHWSRGNPIDVIGDAGPDRYEEAVKIAAHDPNTDGLLVIMTPQAMSDRVDIAKKLVQLPPCLKEQARSGELDGRRKGEQGEAVLDGAGIPTFPFPDAAVRAFNYMWRYTYNLRGLYETPEITDAGGDAARRAAELIEQARKANRTLLTEFESKQLLSLYGIPTVETRLGCARRI